MYKDFISDINEKENTLEEIKELEAFHKDIIAVFDKHNSYTITSMYINAISTFKYGLPKTIKELKAGK